MVAKDCPNITSSPKVEVGKIDTRAPFQSMKDAVSLFGEGALSGEIPAIKITRPHSAERVLAKETQLHLAQKELNKLKEQLKNAETTKAEALEELEKAKRTCEDLTGKLKSMTESKESAIEAAEAARDRVKQLKEVTGRGNPVSGYQELDLESKREEYVNAIAELDAAKQLLRQIRLDRDVVVEAKTAALKQVAEAEDAAKANMKKAGEISKDINAVQESIGQVKLATTQAQQERAEIFAEKDVQKQSYRAAMEESAKRELALRKEFNPEIAKNLEAQLAKTVTETGALQKEMESTKASDVDSLKTVTLELDGAKESLHKVVEEESSLRCSVESLKIELENVKKDHIDLNDKEAETESTAGNLHAKLCKMKSELEAAVREELRVRDASEAMTSTLDQLLSESENARSEAEEMKKKAEELKGEAEVTRITLEEAEKQLKVALEEAEEAKAAERRALYQIKDLSGRTDAARASTSEPGAEITISRDEFEALDQKVEESNKLAEMKMAAAVAQVDAVKASENEAVRKLGVTQKEIDDMKAATQEALKKAEMAEAAKKVVERELWSWHHREQKKAAETASQILPEKELSPCQYQIQKQISPEKVAVSKKLKKQKTFLSKKALLPYLSAIFRRKKNQVEGRSPSLSAW